MAQSINTKCILSVPATSYTQVTGYGKLLIGDKGFEFYSDRNPEMNIQIPWTEIKSTHSMVLFNKWINRYNIDTKENGVFGFASKEPKKVLRIIQDHIGKENMFRQKTITSRIANIFKRK